YFTDVQLTRRNKHSEFPFRLTLQPFWKASVYQRTPLDIIALANRTIWAGCSSVVGIMKITANRYLRRTIITIITIITNAI
ncbi:MAG: hypothetical protein ABJB85_12250, partial [Nitrososphaerota archaeon]